MAKATKAERRKIAEQLKYHMSMGLTLEEAAQKMHLDTVVAYEIAYEFGFKLVATQSRTERRKD